MPRVSRVTVAGLAEASANLTRFLRKLDSVPTQILLDEAPKIEQIAKHRTPIDTGNLKKHVKVRVSRDKRRPGMYAQASAIKARAKSKAYDYAYIQHENDAYKHPRGGQAHFLESAFVEGVDRIMRRLSKEVKYDK